MNLIHEHYFVAKRVKGAEHFINCCITCGDCYCLICGQILGAPIAQPLIQSKTEIQPDNRVLDSKKLNIDIDIMNLALIIAALALLFVPGIIAGNQKALAANLCGSGLGCGGTPN